MLCLLLERRCSIALRRNAHRQRPDPMDEVRINALPRAHDLDHRVALEDLFPQDAQLQFGEPIADAAMDAEAEGEVLPRARAVDDEFIRGIDCFGIAIA